MSTSSYRRDIGIGCVDIENLVSNLTRVFRALQDGPLDAELNPDED